MFNYYKPGNGVNENEPEKNIFSLYFTILWRKFRKFIGINFLYVLCVLPIVFIFAYAASPILMQLGLKFKYMNRYICMVMMYLVFIGIAPLNIGTAAIFKKYSRQQHSWVIGEFFAAVKENFKVCIRLWLIDLLFTGILLADLYFMNAFQGTVRIIVTLTTYFMIFLFIASHFYVYQIILMFDVGAVSALKNAAIIAAAKLPQSLLLFLIILISGTVLNYPLFFLFFGYAPVSFASNLYAERLLTKRYIDGGNED